MINIFIFLTIVFFNQVYADPNSELTEIEKAGYKSEFLLAIDFYEKRAADVKPSGEVKLENIRSTIKYLEVLENKLQKNLLVKFKLIEAYYFLFHHGKIEKSEKESLIQKSLDLSNGSLKLVLDLGKFEKDFLNLIPNEQVNNIKNSELNIDEVSEAYFWNAITWGIWGITFGNFASAKNDVAGKIKSRSEVLIELNPSYRDGAGYRLLGRMHMLAPKIPFFSGWIDRDLGIELLRKANSISTKDPRNLLFLGEALLGRSTDETEEGKRILLELSKRKPNPKNYLEELETIDESKKSIEND